MRRLSALAMLVVVLAGFGLLSCDTVQTVDVTLDITGGSLCLFTGFYETTTNGQAQISGSPPKSYTFQARKSYDIVAAQIVRAGTGELTAKLVSGDVTRDSVSTSSSVGTIHLQWTPK